ncbi:MULTISPECIES: ABC transporter ATP-binding protein [unclassified Mumia]|uniref:ABC transporter ATP-binding protein n=1 Tax=unclassified Mumia TaxID=2621872 RepID=UPI0027E278A8|nr:MULTISPECIES: ABC transporter ATP-binding protein [unclassified Mumia]
MDTMIDTRGLTKEFRSGKKTVTAVKDLDLHIADGEMVALLGPNGAGKSTTLRMLTTLLAPTSGSARVAGLDVTTDQHAVRRAIGYIGQGNSAGHSQRVIDELVVSGRAYGMSRGEARSRAGELLESLALSEQATRKVMTLSGGQRRRLDIAMGLIHSPGLLFLDEPSTGLDPQNRANLQQHVVDLRRKHGATVVLTTHYLDEADALAERIVVIDHGQVVADDTPDSLKAEHAGDRIAMTFPRVEDAVRASERAAAAFPGAQLAHDGTAVDLQVAGGAGHVSALITDLTGAGIAPATVEVARPTLDDVFLALTGRSLREGRTDLRTDPITQTTEEVAA